jgi:hypothetical protein
MLFDFGAGEEVGAGGADSVHVWVEVVWFVGGPGGAYFAARAQTAVMNQPQRCACGEGGEI